MLHLGVAGRGRRREVRRGKKEKKINLTYF
jgi:hypothetical protein